MTGRTVVSLPTAARTTALRHLERRDVDPVALLVAIHDAADTKALADARLAAIFQIGAVGGDIWPGRCPVTTGSDAMALGCLVDRTDAGHLVHLGHGPIPFATRIGWVSARAETRLDGEDDTDPAAATPAPPDSSEGTSRRTA